jgi:glycosyltransferase involved in cell wall biosynthesis
MNPPPLPVSPSATGFVTSSLSVLIPTFRRPELLDHCLRSLRDSSVPASEVLVGDDGGDPETAAVCARHAALLPLVRLPPGPRRSLASNLARLVAAASGEWSLLLHDDDFLTGDHSRFPAVFRDRCDFHFTDHHVADQAGRLLAPKSAHWSQLYGRDTLAEGSQDDVGDLVLHNRVCLDGFYARTGLLRQVSPDLDLGPVCDYFWIFRLLGGPARPRVWYSRERTFAYRFSSFGLTAAGVDHERMILGLGRLVADYPAWAGVLRMKISRRTWHAVNRCAREGRTADAWRLLRAIRLRYHHSLRHQALLPFQLGLLALPCLRIRQFFYGRRKVTALS